MQHVNGIVNRKSVLYSTVMTTIESPAGCVDRPSRREARREERREAILEVSTRYFLEHGYAGTTMSGIAASLGGSKGTLWSYYASKELLFGDVLDRATRDFREQLSLALERDEPVDSALLQVCIKFLARITNRDGIALHRLVIGEAGRFPEMGRIFYERVPQRVHSLLSRFIRLAMDRGELREDDPDEAANNLTALCMAGSHQKLIAGVIDRIDPDQAEELARRAVEKFLRAYR